MSPAEQILQLLQDRPGLKSAEIASELGLDRPQAKATLQQLAPRAAQDIAYRWWPNPRPAAAAPLHSRTFLANLCRYYRACLALESGVGISLPAEETAAYVEVQTLPFQHPGQPWLRSGPRASSFSESGASAHNSLSISASPCACALPAGPTAKS